MLVTSVKQIDEENNGKHIPLHNQNNKEAQEKETVLILTNTLRTRYRKHVKNTIIQPVERSFSIYNSI